MIALNGATVREMFLMHLVHLVESGQHDCLLAGGLPAQALDRLRRLSSRDVLRIASMKVPIKIEIDGEALDQAMTAVSKMSTHETMFELFISRGASLPMMRALFHVEDARVQFTRAVLNTEVRQGRPALPKDDVRDAIHQAWQQSIVVTNTKDRWLALSSKFPTLRLDVLWAVINEFEESKASRQESRV